MTGRTIDEPLGDMSIGPPRVTDVNPRRLRELDCLDAAVAMSPQQADLRWESELRTWLVIEPRPGRTRTETLFRRLSAEELDMRAAIALRAVGLPITADALETTLRMARARYRGHVAAFRIIKE